MRLCHITNARTDTKWFHDIVLPYADIRFIRGRLRFNNSDQNAPFPSMIAVFKLFGNEIKEVMNSEDQ